MNGDLVEQLFNYENVLLFVTAAALVVWIGVVFRWRKYILRTLTFVTILFLSMIFLSMIVRIMRLIDFNTDAINFLTASSSALFLIVGLAFLLSKRPEGERP